MTRPGKSDTPNITRELKHERQVTLRGYLRSDALWDIEAELKDIRAYDSLSVEKGTIPAGDSIHDIRVCVTVDNTLLVTDAQAFMTAVPYHTCPDALASIAAMKGARIGSGWRKAIEERLGGERGCTHIRELLLHIATTAYQTIPVWQAQQSGDVIQSEDGQPPQHLGRCTTWSFNGPVVARIYPQFIGWKSPPHR
ncbi:MAG: DUF2889 domain-containing protein [Pseudomonadota bacterium]